jgi:hypothetical protein
MHVCFFKNKNNFFGRSRSYVFLLVLSASILSNTSITHSNPFEETCNQVVSLSQSAFTQTYLEEVKSLHQSPNGVVDPSIKYVFVLSGRGSYLKEPVDSGDVKDPADDYHRIELGIKIAKQVVASHLDEGSPLTAEAIQKYGPIIVYNGRPKHNEDLKKAFHDGILTHYPEDKFRILDLDPSDWSTRGQFVSIKNELPLSDISVAIVTHAYHAPRVARMIGSKWHPFGPNTKVSLYLVDRNFEAPGVTEDMLGEIDRIPRYIEQGDLAPQVAKKISN